MIKKINESAMRLDLRMMISIAHDDSDVLELFKGIDCIWYREGDLWSPHKAPKKRD